MSIIVHRHEEQWTPHYGTEVLYNLQIKTLSASTCISWYSKAFSNIKPNENQSVTSNRKKGR